MIGWVGGVRDLYARTQQGETHCLIWPRREENEDVGLGGVLKRLNNGKQRLELLRGVEDLRIELGTSICLIIHSVHGLSDNAKIVASTAKGPEQVRVGCAGHRDHFPVGRDKVGRDHIVGREAVEALQPCEAAAETCSEEANTVAVPGG